jgi:hypothetical protein
MIMSGDRLPGRIAVHLSVRRTLTLLALAAGLSFVGTAHAEPDSRPSVVNGVPASCRSAGLPGEIIEVTATVRDNTYVDISAVPAGFQLTGVVVRGLRSFHKYPYLGDLPWNDLQAPGGGQFTGWFACAKPRTTAPTTTTTTTTATTTTTTTTPGGTTTVPTSSTTSSEQVVTTPVSSTTDNEAVASPRDDDALAETGFGHGWMLVLGNGLVIAGVIAVIVSGKRRRARR